VTGRSDQSAKPSGPAPSRRSVLLGGAAGAVGAASLGAAGWLAVRDGLGVGDSAGGSLAAASFGAQTVTFHGTHQPGIATPAQAHAAFIALDLRKGQGVEPVRRWLQLLTSDAARLMSGRVPLASEDREIAALPARLTVTVGFGPGLFDAIDRGDQCPDVIRALPAFATDRLRPEWSGGDLLLQVCSDEPQSLAFASRWLVRDSREFATVRWSQRGFTRAKGTEPDAATPRNLFGQRDGTINPRGAAELDTAVWSRSPDWLVGGSMLVLRRIAMDLEAWDDLGRPAREFALARRMSDGAPTSGGSEFDEPDLKRLDAQGLPVVDPSAHAVVAKAQNPAEVMLRRGYSYDDPPARDGSPNSGLIFAAYQADAATAFVPVQRRLAEKDALNTWITHIGSATFAVPPGCPEGGYLGQQLLEG
jgi:dye decolorizing peroxidase